MKFLVTLLTLASSIYALDPIEVKGNAFWVKGTNERFYIRGVDYQPGGSSNLEDPIADTKVCERDIPYFKDLGVNTVRVYSVDNTKNHDECMQKLADAGIYVILDVNTPFSSITREGAACSYNSDYLREVFATISEFAKYNNTLGFFAGNEVINNGASLDAAPYVKAVVRDAKNFIKNRKLRTIPVGYSAASVAEYRLLSALYFNCGDDDMARIDMYGINDYSWCGDASMTTSQYSAQMNDFKDYTVPIFFSEFGCITIRPRTFSDIEVIYSDEMSSVFSGGLVYEYSEQANSYGLVELNGNKVSTNQDFDNLKKQYANVKNPNGDGGYLNSNSANDCPAKSSDWNVTTTLPDTPLGALKYLKGVVEPQGDGFNAYVQQNCNAPDNNVDDSGKYSSTLDPKSAGQTAGGSTSKKSDGELVTASSFLSFLAFIAGFITV